MIIYNVTINIEKDVHDEWLHWMKTVHVPDVMRTGHFTENKICKVLVEEEQGITYSFQYTCKNMEELNKYLEQHAPRLRKDVADKYYYTSSALYPKLKDHIKDPNTVRGTGFGNSKSSADFLSLKQTI